MLNESKEYAAAYPYIAQAAVEIHSAVRQLELLIEHLPGDEWQLARINATKAIDALEIARSRQMITRAEMIFVERGFR